MHTIDTSRFGKLSYDESDIIVFPRGLPGFERNRSWALAGESDSIIKWLQSLDDAELALPITTPDIVMPDYNARIPQDELELLGESNGNADMALVVVVSIPTEAPWNMTVNLRAPIVINTASHKAAQVIVLNDEYPVRHFVFSDSMRAEMKAKALAGRD